MRPRSASTVPTDEAPSPPAEEPGRHAAPARPDGLERAARWAAILAPALLLMWAGWVRRWTTDDGFINFRIVHQLVEGNGPVFNVGQRVEAYTSPLWLGTLAVGDLLLPLRLEYVSLALSIPLAGLGIVAMGAGARRLWQLPGDHWWLPFGTIVLLAVAPVWDFTTSGLEFGLTLAWIGGLVWVLGRWSDGDRPLTPVEAVIVGLGPLVRPDTTLYTLTVLALVVVLRWKVESWGDRIRVVAIAFALPVLYQLFRMAYFAALVPNTAMAKGADVSHWDAGWTYLRNLVGTYQLLIPIALLAVVGFLIGREAPAPRRWAMAVLPATALLQTLGIVRAGGDYIHARLLLPAVVAFVAPLALIPVRRALLVPVAALTAWGVVSATTLRMEGSVRAGRSLIADGHAVATGSTGLRNPVTKEQNDYGELAIIDQMDSGIWIGVKRTDLAPRDDVRTPLSIMYGIGVGGFDGGSRLQVLDRLGLAHPIASRLVVDEPGFIGHEKLLPDPWVLALVTDQDAPDDILGESLLGTPLYTSPPGQLSSDADVARQVLRCKALADLQHAISDPWTFGRAMRNIGESFGLTRLRIPPDPDEARRELC